MLRSGYVFLCWIIVVAQAYSQSSSKVDSLLAALPNATDTSKIKILIDVGWELVFIDPPIAFEYSEQALSLATEAQYLKGIGHANSNLGFIKYNQSDFPSAIQYFLTSLKVEEQIGNPARIGHRLNAIGMVYGDLKKYDLSLSYYQKSVSITQSIPDKLPLLFALNGLGIMHMNRGLLVNANTYFSQMYDVANSVNNQSLAGLALRHLGEISMITFQYDLAVRHLTKAIEIFSKIDDKAEEAIAVNNLGEVYYKMEDYEKAEKYAKAALEIRMDTGFQYGIIITQSLLALIYLKQGLLDQAMLYADSSLVLARKLKVKGGVSEALEALVQIYLEKKDYNKAIAYKTESIAIKDSIFNEEISIEIARLQSRFELEKKEQQITSQQQQIVLLEQNKAIEKKLRFTFIISTILAVLLASFIFQRYRLKQKAAHNLFLKNKEIASKNREIERVNRELEKRMLRAQMDPHFVFNSLSAIQHFITISDKTSALKYLSRFSRLIRQVLENSVSITVPIADELKVLEYYLELESLRFNHQFEYCIDVDQNINIHDSEIPFLLLQPYVENSIVHGFCKGGVRGKLKIILKRQQNSILCIIEDNGIGRDAAQSLNGRLHHIPRGVSVAQQRLSLINEENQEKTTVEITDLYDWQNQPSGTKVIIQIPLDYN